MTPTALSARLSIGAILLLATALSFWALDKAPAYVGIDEARFALHSDAIARTGRDLNGTVAPLYFHITNPIRPEDASPAWWQPLLFYLMAAVFGVMPLSEWSLRFPTACVAVLNVWLTYVVGYRLAGNRWHGIVAALILALTPAHFIFARQAQDYFLILPIALAWVWCLMQCLQSGSPSWLAATGLLLGVGLYSHISSWIVMPFFLTVTLAATWRTHPSRSTPLWIVGGFAVAMMPLLAWLWGSPSLLNDMFTNYKVASNARFAERVDIYWDYFNPSFLFFSGGSSPMFATRRAGVFLLAAAILLPLGAWNIWKRQPSIAGRAVVATFLFAPVPITIALPEAPKYYTPRALLLVPFGALLCAAGVAWLWERRGQSGRILALLALISMPIQFAGFARYFFTDYQIWSAARFDPFNARGAVDFVIAADAIARVPAVFLSEKDFGEPHAQLFVFHLLARGARDLWTRTHLIDAAQFDDVDTASGSLLVVDSHNSDLEELRQSSRCSIAAVINDIGGLPAAVIVRRH